MQGDSVFIKDYFINNFFKYCFYFDGIFLGDYFRKRILK